MKRIKTLTILILTAFVSVFAAVFAADWFFFGEQSLKKAQANSTVQENSWVFVSTPKALLVGDTAYLVYDGNTYSVGGDYNGQPITGIDTKFNRASTDSAILRSSGRYLNVVIDPSFINFKPTSTAFWFSQATNSMFTGLEYIDTSNVETMESMFFSSVALSSLDAISGWNTSSVENMSGMFSGCTNLTDIDLSGWDTSSVVNMSNVFAGCTGLTTVDLSSWNTSNVINMNGMFFSCFFLDTIFVDPLLWSTEGVFISSNMFYDCTYLRGGNGTEFNSNNIGHTMAKVDGYNGQSGYLTDIAQKPQS